MFVSSGDLNAKTPSKSPKPTTYTQHWHKTGASEFGNCGDAGSIGYRGDYLPTKWKSFAELDNGFALGGLAYDTPIRVWSPVTHRKLTIRKRDVGGGGGNVFGLPRTIDLYQPVAHYLVGAQCTWTGIVYWRYLHNGR